MSASSKGYYELVNSVGLLADEPCDTAQTWTTLDNIIHMVEIYPGYKVNWCDSVGLKRFARDDGNGNFIADLRASVSFTASCIYSGLYPNYDVRAACSVSTGTTMAASLILATPSAGFFSDLTDPNVLGIVSGITTSTTAVWCVDGKIESRQSTMVGTTLMHTDAASGTDIPSQVFFVRADIGLYATLTSASDYISLKGLQIREYPNT